MTLPAFSSIDLIRQIPDVLRIFLAVWLFAVGGCVGSFLNVVVLRLPAGMGIARSGSRCPVCLHCIRWYDNIPIISWLVLRGRCRDCRTPISKRYPLVELLVASLFLMLGSPEVLLGGVNLPWPGDAGYSPFQYWSLYTFHVVTVVTLLGATLIERDRHEAPGRLFVPALLAGLLASIGLPFLHPVPVGESMVRGHWMDGLVAASGGLFAGGLLGAAAWPATNRQVLRPRAGRTAILACATAGLCLGWQAAGPVVAVTGLAFLLASVIACLNTPLGRGIWCGYLVVSLVAYIMCWRSLVDWLPAVGAGGAWWILPASVIAVLLVSILTAWFTPARETIQQLDTEGTGMASPVDRDANLKSILESPSYLPVEYDAEFLQQWETRPVRVQLELLKPEIGLMSQGVESTIVVFGGTQVVEAKDAEEKLRVAREELAKAPDDPQCKRTIERLVRIAAKASYYDAARDFARLVSSNCQIDGQCDYVIVTGGGPGIMEAANRGAYDVGAKSIGLNITLPAEQVPNPYITPNLCFQFHYFALRKMHFLMRAKAMVVFPGGFGTLDELFDALTLRQTHRMQEIPVILFGQRFWNHVVDFQFLADEGVIADADLELINFAETPEEAWEIITRFHAQVTG